MQGSWPEASPGLRPGSVGLRCAQSQQRALVLEQPALAVQTAAEPRELAARPDHAVARDNNGDGVFTVGGAHRARRARIAETARQLAVVGRGAVGNGTEQVPDAMLES